MYLLTTENITKRFTGHTALDKVSISVPKQSIFGLLGPNGAGKTTLIRIINQITGPDEGKLLFEGQELKPSHIYQIGYLPEERGLYKKMKVGEQALYLARLKGLSKNEALKKLKYWFEKFEIQAWWGKKVEELSKGMQQKMQFIITVIHQPKLLIFDEPFSGFDPINVNIIKEEILKLRELGTTIIFSTHNMASVEELCDHIALINKSVKILEGKVDDIKKTYKSNIYQLGYQSTSENLKSYLTEDFEILETENNDDHFLAKIKILGNANPNQLITELLPHVGILSFNEILPSMNDIFIRKVNEDLRVNQNLN